MYMSKEGNYFYEFGPFRLDPGRRLLLRDVEPLPLRPKAFDTLLVLVQNSGRVLNKDELMQAVWGDTIVEEGGLTRNISVLRKTLGESPDHHRYIVTAPGRGYCFVATVRKVDSEDHDEAKSLVVENHALSRMAINDEDSTSLGGAGAANELIAVTDELIAVTEAEANLLPVPSGAYPARRLNVRRLGMVASIVTFVAVALVVFFNRGPANIKRDTVLLADFANTTGEAVFDGTLRQGLAIQLEQSPFLNIFPDERVRDTLRLMGRGPEERTTVAVGREICQRQGIKALVSGSIASLGSHYVITLEAVASQTGEVISQEQVEVERKEDVLGALGKAATRLRKQLGESLSSIQRFDTPIEQATTSSLDALKAYSLGLERANKGAYPAAVPFYQRAVEIDPNFAQAYQALAREQLNTSYSDLVAEAASKAYELRERTTENEKFRIVSFYHLSVTHDLNKAIEVGELWKQTYPNYWRPYHALADLYYTTGQYDKGLAAAREAVRLNPDVAAAYSNLAGSLLALNRVEEAKEVYRQAMARNLDAPEYHYNLFWIAWLSGDAATTRQQIAWFAGSSYAYGGIYAQSLAAATVGRWREALDLSGRAFEMLERRGMKGEVGGWAQLYALTSAALGDRKTSRRMAAVATASTTREIDLSAAAIALALCGDAGQAQALADRLARRFPKDPTLNGSWLPTIRAAIEVTRDLPNHGTDQAPDRAIDALKAVGMDEATARFWPAYVSGLAYLRKRMGAEAATTFQKILRRRDCTFWTPLYGLAHLGLARATALTGDIGKSRKAYQDFFALWKDADPDIPILRESKQEYERLRFD